MRKKKEGKLLIKSRENFRKMLRKFEKTRKNFGKILRKFANFVDKLCSTYQNTLRKTEKAYDFK